MNLFPFKLLIKSLKFFGSITCFFDNFFSLTIFEALSIWAIKNNSLFFPIINLQLGIGLLGLSEPLIFNIQATFSGALINR